MPRLRLALVVAAVVVGVLLGSGHIGGGRGSDEAGLARVQRVVDGDTIAVDLDGRPERVRYIGIDTPETHKPGTPVQCFGPRASRENERLVEGRQVRLVADREARDRYGRLLAYVYRVEDDLFVNAALVRGGYARTLVIRPNDLHAAQFADLARTARTARRGLWGACRG